MQRTLVNLIIDALAALLLLGMIATGYLLHFPLPPGTNKSLSLWGLSRHQWGEVHFWISIGLLIVLLVHLVLHWQWIVTVVQKRLHLPKSMSRSHLVGGLITVAIIAATLTLFAWSAHVSVTEREDSGCPPSTETRLSQSSDLLSTNQSRGRAKSEVEFRMDVYPLLKSSCLSCHGPNKVRGGFRVDRRQDYFRKEGQPPLVVPGSSAKSPLIDIVSGARKDIAMPDRHKLLAHQVSILKSWIDSGAKWTEQNGRE